MDGNIPVHIGLNSFTNEYPNHVSHMVNRLTYLLKKDKRDSNIILTVNKVNRDVYHYFSDFDKISIIDDKEITTIISEKYPWFSDIRGYGFVRLIQYLLSPNGCIIRDQDTLEMDSNLLKYQFEHLGKMWNGQKISYIFSDYFGRGLPQLFDGPTPIDLNILDQIWYSENSDERHMKSGRIGKLMNERFSEFSQEMVGWGNHGSCAIHPSLFLNIPPIAGPIRGGDDSLPLRILGWVPNSGLGNVITPYQVSHMIYNQSIPIDHSVREIRKIVDTIMFNPYWETLEDNFKHITNNTKFEELTSKVASVMETELDLEKIKMKQTKLKTKIEDVFDKWENKYDSMSKIRSLINIDNSIGSADQTFDLTMKIYLHWKELFAEFSPIITSRIQPLEIYLEEN